MDYTNNKDFIELCELLSVDAGWFPEFDDFTAAPDFLLEVVKGIMSTHIPQNIVECGCGISTLVIAQAVRLKGKGRVTSLEHDPAYSSRCYTWLDERGLSQYSDVYLRPLTSNPPWYHLGNIIIENIDMLIIDGPPAYIHPQSRYGARTLFTRLKKGGVIYVDDAHREGAVIGMWRQEFPELSWSSRGTERGLSIGVMGLLAGFKKEKKKVLVAIPTEGSIHKLLSIVLLKMQMDTRYKLRIIHPSHSPSDNNRHHIIKDFLAHDEDYLLMIDSDNPPVNNPLDLVELDRDVMGYPTPVWHFTGKVNGERPIYENAYKYVPSKDAYTEWPDKEGLQRVDAIGTGCILIARRVLEHPGMKGKNQRTLDEDGCVVKGGDIMFCEAATECGFEIYAHYNYRCQHFKELELHEVARAFGQMNRG